MARDELVGYHKGCLMTLSKEREELLKIVGITEQLMAMHLKSLKELGVDVTKETVKAQGQKLDEKVKKESIS